MQGNIELADIFIDPGVGAGATARGTGGDNGGKILINGNLIGMLLDPAAQTPWDMQPATN